MNGRLYICDGCGRTGAIDPRACWYECPICRFVCELPDRQRASVWITLNSLNGKPFTRIRPWVWPEYQHKDKGAQLHKHRQEMCGDMRTRWYRWYQYVRYVRRVAQEGSGKRV